MILSRPHSSLSQPGFVLAFVKRPPNWVPRSPVSVPPLATIVEKQAVTSYDAAYSELLRTNRAAMSDKQALWAMFLRNNPN